MINVILTVILAVIIGGAGYYIYKSRKSGASCIGCPEARHCAARKRAMEGGGCDSCAGCSGCGRSGSRLK